MDVLGASPFTLCELESKSRISELVMWRQFLVSVAKAQKMTYFHAGKLVNRDHSTVINAMKCVYYRVQDKQFPEYREVLNKIKQQIEFNITLSEDVCVNELNCMVMLDQLIGKKFQLCAY
jgi:chromosomal replication initiation ATPase DnaA